MAVESAKQDVQVGGKMSDGTIYAGESPYTHHAMYTTSADEPLTCTFGEASRDRQPGWRLPTKEELSMLFKNRAAIGGFDESGLNHAGWYWSSSTTMGKRDWDSSAWLERFSDGCQLNADRNYKASVRLVRSC